MTIKDRTLASATNKQAVAFLNKLLKKHKLPMTAHGHLKGSDRGYITIDGKILGEEVTAELMLDYDGRLRILTDSMEDINPCHWCNRNTPPDLIEELELGHDSAEGVEYSVRHMQSLVEMRALIDRQIMLKDFWIKFIKFVAAVDEVASQYDPRSEELDEDEQDAIDQQIIT